MIFQKKLIPEGYRWAFLGFATPAAVPATGIFTWRNWVKVIGLASSTTGASQHLDISFPSAQTMVIPTESFSGALSNQTWNDPAFSSTINRIRILQASVFMFQKPIITKDIQLTINFVAGSNMGVCYKPIDYGVIQ